MEILINPLFSLHYIVFLAKHITTTALSGYREGNSCVERKPCDTRHSTPTKDGPGQSSPVVCVASGAWQGKQRCIPHLDREGSVRLK